MNTAQVIDSFAALSASAAPVTLFYSYAHEDEALRDELQGHLKILERRGLLAPWHDRRIVPGEDWAQRIDENLRSAELVLLLVSKDFIVSEYIMGTELGAAMARHAQHQTVVVPIVVRAIDFDPNDADELPFLRLQGLPTDLKPVTSWPNRDEAWTNVAKGLRSTVKAIREQRPVAKAQMPSPSALPPACAPMPSAPASAPGTEVFDHFDFDSMAAPSPALPEWGLGSTAPAPAQPDPVLERVVQGAVGLVEGAQRNRGEPALDAIAQQRLRDGTQALIDLPDQKRVLWVDDRPEGNRFEAAALAHLQIEVVAVHDTDAAMAQLATDTEGFDLVISDWERPAEGAQAGLRLLQRLRATGSAVPLVYYHATAGAAQRAQRAEQARAAGALGEAVLPSDLMALVRCALLG
jgi:CheY-like chemotaxis protein